MEYRDCVIHLAVVDAILSRDVFVTQQRVVLDIALQVELLFEKKTYRVIKNRLAT